MLDPAFPGSTRQWSQPSVLHQDNKSNILLEKNGKMSSGKCTKHVIICHFVVMDRVSKGKVSIKWHPTKKMVADHATKPVQGTLFKRFRDLIMGVIPLNDSSTSKEKKLKDLDNKDDTKEKPGKGNKKCLAPQKEVPQECIGDSFRRKQDSGASICCVRVSAYCMGEAGRIL